ncbi:MAG: hypothetical protein EHM19_05140 [Candidatus Latescibacterota bacterium]|nr:MAG: hypothetical protein EHM19_05140 [Candidatus Latescibacterota bacterium]
MANRIPFSAGRALLVIALLAGGLRVWDAARDRAGPGRGTRAAGAPAAEEPALVSEARAVDLGALQAGSAVPSRDPFRAAARLQPPGTATPTSAPSAPTRSSSFAIPRVERVDGEGPDRRVVLGFGGESSKPLGPGEAEQGWRILAIEKAKVFVEREGVIYTLPLP